MSNPTSPHTDFPMTFSRPQFDWEEIREFFAPVLDDDEPPTSEPPSPRSEEATR